MVDYFKKHGVKNWQKLFDMFPERTKEEVIFEFLNLPFESITQVDVFSGNKKDTSVTIDQKEALNTLIAHDPHAIDDYDNPIIQHASVFKMMLDKVKSGKGLLNDKKKFEDERDDTTDTIIDRI